MIWTYIIIVVILLAAELAYFKIADRFNIIDKPNERSSHTRIVLRGGGVIFTIALWIWYLWLMVQGEWLTVNEYWPLTAGVTLAAGVSFVDDIHSLPDSLRLVVQFIGMALVLFHVQDSWFSVHGLAEGLFSGFIFVVAMIVAVGGTNIYNFMDGINGITGGYSLAMMIPLYLLNMKYVFVDESLLVDITLSLLVFCLFNFRTKAK
mgnify:CR=1 FL=1